MHIKTMEQTTVPKKLLSTCSQNFSFFSHNAYALSDVPWHTPTILHRQCPHSTLTPTSIPCCYMQLYPRQHLNALRILLAVGDGVWFQRVASDVLAWFKISQAMQSRCRSYLFIYILPNALCCLLLLQACQVAMDRSFCPWSGIVFVLKAFRSLCGWIYMISSDTLFYTVFRRTFRIPFYMEFVKYRSIA